MTSLIGWTIYLGHQGVVKHRREKQRVKNYERWEGLRDEYDDQKRVQRETRSLDLQRTGFGGGEAGGFDNGYGYGVDDRHILTLRDMQEANDARTGWRPQESWESGEERLIREQKTGYQPMTAHGRPGLAGDRRSMDLDRLYAQHTQTQIPVQQQQQQQQQWRPQDHRAVSMATGFDQTQHEQGGSGANGAALSLHQTQPAPAAATAAKRLSNQKTGAVWDDGLPPPLAVTRRNWDEQNQNASTGNLSVASRSTSHQRASLQPSPRPSEHGGSKAGSYESLPTVTERPPRVLDPIESHVPGGFMATLIEGRSNLNSNSNSIPHSSMQQVSNNPFEQQQQQQFPQAASGIFTPPATSGSKSNNPFEHMASRGEMPPTPAGEKDMMEWWK